MALTRAELASPKKYYSLPLNLDCLQHSRGIWEKLFISKLDWTKQELPDYDTSTNTFPFYFPSLIFFLFTQLLHSHLCLPHISCFFCCFYCACNCKVVHRPVGQIDVPRCGISFLLLELLHALARDYLALMKRSEMKCFHSFLV